MCRRAVGAVYVGHAVQSRQCSPMWTLGTTQKKKKKELRKSCVLLRRLRGRGLAGGAGRCMGRSRPSLRGRALCAAVWRAGHMVRGTKMLPVMRLPICARLAPGRPNWATELGRSVFMGAALPDWAATNARFALHIAPNGWN